MTPTGPSRNASWVFTKASFSRYLIDIIAWPEHLNDSINMSQLHLETHNLVTPHLYLAINASALVNKCGHNVCFGHPALSQLLSLYPTG